VTDFNEHESYTEDALEASDFSRLLPPPGEPLKVAEVFLTEMHETGTLRYWHSAWWEWLGPRWAEADLRTVERALYDFTRDAGYLDPAAAKPKLKPWAPTRHKITDVLHALAANTYLHGRIEDPSWIETPSWATGSPIVAVDNGLLDVVSRKLHPHTPTYWNGTAVDLAYDAKAPAPTTWLQFLDALWPGDPEQVALLQQWFGYILSGRQEQHKILLIIGPPRSGKGTIANTLGALVGHGNIAAPTMSSFKGDFGLAPLIGKTLAIIPDARLGGAETNIITERLLSLSGGDPLTVNIKYQQQWTGYLPTRIMICSNELPRLGDASGAVASRFATLMTPISWLGREDTTIGPRILDGELPGVLRWALDGLKQLEKQHRFTDPASCRFAYTSMLDLSSPVGHFIREHCTIDLNASVPCAVLYAKYCDWAADEGHGRPSAVGFGRDLVAANPTVRRVKGGVLGARVYQYQGISLVPAADPFA
jgi:putative DNA primase/helicase